MRKHRFSLFLSEIVLAIKKGQKILIFVLPGVIFCAFAGSIMHPTLKNGATEPNTYKTTGQKQPTAPTQKMILRQTLKLAKATAIFVPTELGFEANSAVTIPRMPDEYLVPEVPLPGGAATEPATSLSSLIETKVTMYRQTSDIPFSLANFGVRPETRVQDFAGRLETMTETILFFVNQLETFCFTNAEFIVVSPALHDLYNRAKRLHEQVKHEKKMIGLSLVVHTNLAGSLYGTDDAFNLRNDTENEAANIILCDYFRQSEEVLREFLEIKFNIHLTTVSGRGTADHRILKGLINVQDRSVLNWNLNRIQPIESFEMAAQELNDLLALYEEQMRRILVAVYNNTFFDGSCFKVNPFYIHFASHGIPEGLSRLDFLEGYTEVAHMPENIEQFFDQAKIKFLGQPMVAAEGKTISFLFHTNPVENHFFALARYNRSFTPSPAHLSFAKIFDAPLPRLANVAHGEVEPGAIVQVGRQGRYGYLLQEPIREQLPAGDNSPGGSPKPEETAPAQISRKRGRAYGGSGAPVAKPLFDSPNAKRARGE